MMTEAEVGHNLALLVWERVVLPNEQLQVPLAETLVAPEPAVEIEIDPAPAVVTTVVVEKPLEKQQTKPLEKQQKRLRTMLALKQLKMP